MLKYLDLLNVNMKDRSQKENELKDELNRCLLLKSEDKKFWLDHITLLPDKSLENVLKAIKKKNSIVDEYIDAAFADDPEHNYLAELKSKIKKIKEKAFEMDESKEKESAEEILRKKLENL